MTAADPPLVTRFGARIAHQGARFARKTTLPVVGLTSVGGGVIGAGEHEPVAAATHRLLAEAQAHLDRFHEDDDGAFPEPGWVRFHLLTPSGSRRRDVPEVCFWGGAPHELDAVVAATQDVVSAMRGASEQ